MLEAASRVNSVFLYVILVRGSEKKSCGETNGIVCVRVCVFHVAVF